MPVRYKRIRMKGGGADRLIEDRIRDPALGNRTMTYEYDPVGNRMTRNDNGVVTEYSYDDNDRLLTENGYSYTYCAVREIFTRQKSSRLIS